jgi:hypothetical protein
MREIENRSGEIRERGTLGQEERRQLAGKAPRKEGAARHIWTQPLRAGLTCVAPD